MFLARIIVNGLLGIAVLFLPWWATLIGAFGALMLFPLFVEFVLWMFIAEALSGGMWQGVYFPGTLGAVGIVALAELIKEKIRVP